MADTTQDYTPGSHPDLPPPASEVGLIGWLRHNLFATPLDWALTIFAVYLIYLLVVPALDWMIFSADWSGETREDCSREGACWVFARVWSKVFVYGRYPVEELWRVNLTFIIQFVGLAALMIPGVPFKKWTGIFLLVPYPILAFILLYGGAFGLEAVETSRWGGLLVTLVIAEVGIVASLPIGIVLALGRRSKMPIIRAICVAFIELWRGVPLISVLFMASVMFPLFMPEGVNFDKLLRALIGVAMFSAAYMAEVVRGGLQAIPKGQYEAAQALGLSYPKVMGFIVLPQALKLVIPGIVNTFIGLFKDTTLVLIIGLFDLLGVVQLAATNPDWLGFAVEGYVVAGVGFWVFCFGMSRYSMYMERKLETGHKR
ncbi:MAG: amino acid ABC transporter permease [Kiloniellales bacterium]|nr:amino acid ABC transporter permease [Kiloniellales bacterium]